MIYVNKYKSPNYNSRNKSKIKLIIIHYTALKNNEDAILYLCNKRNKVSSHYLISQKGIVYNLVDDKLRAWHAGLSFWQDYKDINSISIGIELDYNPYGRNNKFSYKMILSLKKLLINIQKKYKISKSNILAHSDIAPFRKKDTGKYFPWQTLSANGVAFNIKKIKKTHFKIIESWFHHYNIKSKKKIIIMALSLIGYDTQEVYKNSKLYKRLVGAYKIRFMNNYKDKTEKIMYNIVITHLFNFLLTKK